MEPVGERNRALTYTVMSILLFVHHSLPNVQGMIGELIKIEEHPYFAFLESGEIRCGAVIVGIDFAMTSAMCARNHDNSPIKLFAGDADEALGETVEVKKACTIEADGDESNNFSMLRFDKSLEFSDKIQNVTWYNESDHHNADWWTTARCFAIGGGIFNSSDGEDKGSIAHKSRVKLVSCSEDKSLACYKHTKKGETTCREDEGGPIICERGGVQGRQYAIYGIITNSSATCEPDTSEYAERQVFSASWLPTFVENYLKDCTSWESTRDRFRSDRGRRKNRRCRRYRY